MDVLKINDDEDDDFNTFPGLTVDTTTPHTSMHLTEDGTHERGEWPHLNILSRGPPSSLLRHCPDFKAFQIDLVIWII